ncbi:MAG: radical SAM protein [Proteobacteria bacterium]|nr:radical SAM protein [Pseudomonadota bacterium]
MLLTKILLVSPNRFREPYPVYPLALSYLKSYLEKRSTGLEIELFDFNNDDLAFFRKLLLEFKPDLVGFSLRNIDTVNYFNDIHFVQECRDLIEEVKSHSDAMTVLGGAGFSIFPETIFNLIRPDYGVFGEGEESLYQLIDALREDRNVADIEGLLYLNDGEVVFNQRKTYCKDPELIFDDHLVDHYWETAGMLNLQTKRGCPYRCAYCTYPLIDGAKIRAHNPEKVVWSLKELNKNKGIDYFFFTDSVFNIHNPYNIELAEHIVRAELNIQWGAYFTPHNLDFELLALLKKSGLTHLEFGTESLSNSTLKAYNKNFLVEDVFETAGLCKKLDLFTAHFLILGGPGESEQTVAETIQNSKCIDKTVFFPYFGMRIYPHTGVYEQAVAEGKIKREDSLLDPIYYLVEDIDFESVKKRARETQNRWIFPDENFQKPMEMMRKRGLKGPLWELLIK